MNDTSNKKTARQEIGVTKWFNSKCVGIIDYAPGVGKTNTAVLAIKRLEKFVKSSYIISVPSEHLKKHWEQAIQKNFTKELQDRIYIKSALEILNEELRIDVGTLIIDELHEYATDERLNILNKYKINYKYFLGLTGSADDKNFFKIKMLFPIVDIITEEEARELGFISDFIEYNLGIALSKIEREDYLRYTSIIDSSFDIFRKDILLVQRCLNGGKDKYGEYYSGLHWATSLAMKNGWNRNLDFNILENRELDDNWNPNNLIVKARRIMKAIRERKQLLYMASNKYTTTIALLKKIDKVKTIVFSESTSFADRLTILAQERNIPSACYHSNLKTKMVTSQKSGKLVKYGKLRQKKDIIEAIKTGKIRGLFTSKSLDRGLDVPDIRCGITTSGTSNPTQYKQRGGRVKRIEANIFGENILVLLVNLYCINTVEESWLKYRQKGTTHTIINIADINAIDYIPPPNSEFIT